MSLLLLAILAVPTEIEIHYMPPGEKVYLPSAGRWGRGFDLEGYKTLLQMDNDLHSVRQQLKLVVDLEFKWDQFLLAKDEMIETYRDDAEKYKERSERLDKRWMKCEDDLIEASGTSWPYLLAIGGAALGLIGISLYVGAVTVN